MDDPKPTRTNLIPAIGTLARSQLMVALALVCIVTAGFGIAAATSSSETSSTDASAEASPSVDPSSDPNAITAGGGGGGTINNEVVVLNTTDGRFANRAGFGTAKVTGDSAENQNAAAATSSCTDCRTVAVAVQIVLIQRTDASNISPRNYAIALNNNCLRCQTFAAAYQYVVTTEGIVRFTAEGQQRLADLQSQIRTLAATDGIPFPELEARIDALVEQMWAVVDEQVTLVGGGSGRAFKDSDQATEGGTSPSPSLSPSDPASPDADPSGSGSPTPSVSPSDQASTEPTPAPSPSG